MYPNKYILQKATVTCKNTCYCSILYILFFICLFHLSLLTPHSSLLSRNLSLLTPLSDSLSLTRTSTSTSDRWVCWWVDSGFWVPNWWIGGLCLFEIGGHGSGLLSHGLGFDFGNGFGFDLWCFGGSVFLVFWIYSWLWIYGVLVEGVFLVVGLWFWWRRWWWWWG